MNELISFGLLLGLFFELLTVFARMVFGSKKVQIARMKKKPLVRIHHLYTGIFVLALYFIWPYSGFLVLGIALTLSDALHHFVVLPIWVGRTEFP